MNSGLISVSNIYIYIQIVSWFAKTKNHFRVWIIERVFWNFKKKIQRTFLQKIQNEFIYIFYEFFIESLRNESDKASCITLCIDKTTVISKVEQLVVALRYFIDFKVVERFVSFFDCYSWLESISDLKDFSLIRKKYRLYCYWMFRTNWIRLKQNMLFYNRSSKSSYWHKKRGNCLLKMPNIAY